MSKNARNQSRVPGGVPSGGQFSTGRRAESDVSSLTTPAPALEAAAGGSVAGVERIVLPGFISPEARDELWNSSFETRQRGEVMPDRVDRLAARYPAMSREEIVSAVEELAAIDESDYLAQREYIEEFSLDEQARRGIHPAAPPTGRIASHEEPYGYTGSLYDSKKTITQVAKDVRGDIKKSQLSGYLPPDLTYSVTTRKFAGGASMRVSVRGLEDDQIYDRREEPDTRFSRTVYTPEADELRRRVGGLIAARNYDRSDSMTDYFDVGFYSSVDLEDAQSRDFRLREAARRKARGLAS
jgi:hypothetical protein